jgi:DNA-binding NtrC family response regulator
MTTIADMRRTHRKQEARLIELELECAGWNLTRAAECLGVSRSSLQRLLTRHPELEAEYRERSKVGRPKK